MKIDIIASTSQALSKALDTPAEGIERFLKAIELVPTIQETKPLPEDVLESHSWMVSYIGNYSIGDVGLVELIETFYLVAFTPNPEAFPHLLKQKLDGTEYGILTEAIEELANGDY